MSEDLVRMEGFHPLGLEDRGALGRALKHEQPVTSELTFTNLYMWRELYRPQLGELAGCLAVVCHVPGEAPFALPPFGPGEHAEAVAGLCRAMAAAGAEPRLARAPQALADALEPGSYTITPTPEHSDYVYLARELIDLPGRRFHKKKNHLNKFLKNNDFEYKRLDGELVESVLDMQNAWCQLRDCDSQPGLANEDQAIFNALSDFDRLDCLGGAIVIGGSVEAFTLGEPLNDVTAVVHIEKANPDIDGLYAAINNLFCRDAWGEMEYVNREQDLGLAGLRKAKRSYQPHHMVDKHLITPDFP